jgi:organic radical activating enzyme
MSPAEIAEYTNSIRQAHRSVVFTGGEPAIQQIGIIKVIEELKKDGEEWYFEIETNGTLPLIPPLAAHINQFNCSPKLESSGNLEKARNVPLAIQKLMEYGTMPGKGVCFKFVVFMETWEKDLAEIEKWRLQHNVPKEFIYLMPEGITAERIKEASLFLNEVAMTQGYQMSTRLQVLLYGDKRAV